MTAAIKSPRVRGWAAVSVLAAAAIAGGTMAFFGAQRATAQADDLVAQNYPADLDAEATVLAQSGGPAPSRSWDSVEVDLLGGGQVPSIVAVYSNGFSSRLRVIHRTGAIAQVIDGPVVRGMGGLHPSMSALDTDGDARPELLVSFDGAGGDNEEWMFRWTTSGLDSIGPTTVDAEGIVSSTLGAATFHDLDADGRLEAIASGPRLGDRSAPTAARAVYRLVSGRYEFWKNILFATQVIRGTARLTTHDFDLELPPGVHSLVVLNGNEGGTNRLHSGVIKIDGAVVVPACAFGATVGEIRVPVTVGAASTLSVEARGSRGNELFLFIE
jgi:hypothetical protein